MPETDTTPVTDIEARVRAGAELLDARSAGWIDLINLDRLDLQSPECCILGQLSGSYEVGARNLSGMAYVRADEWSSEFGFFSQVALTEAPDDYADEGAFDEYDAAQTDEYRELTAAWRSLITERRASDAH